MPKYLIERNVPGIGSLSARDLKALSIKSNKVLSDMANIQWQESYVSGDKLHCIYIADNEDLVREHAKRGEFPMTNIYEVGKMIDPTTAED